MTRRPRVFYLGMITTDAYGRAIGERPYSGAATRKMLLVSQAMRSVGLRAVVVSLPFVGTRAKRFGFKPVVTSNDGVPVLFTATLRSAVLRKLVGPFFLLCAFQRHAQRGDTMICYNHAVEYLPVLLALRLRGVRLVQDIEDAPTGEERGLRRSLNRFSFALTSRLTVSRKMVVADHVAEIVGLEDFVTIRGVTSQETGDAGFPDTGKWRELREGGPMRLHYGGSLMTETGIDLFCGAVDRLARATDRLSRDIAFKITGVGELDKIQALRDRIGSVGRVTVDLLPELNQADYRTLLDSCHGSLSLKRPGSAMSNTTFPSKVIEITAAGMALVSTRLGDVVDIFNGSAYFLDEYSPEALAEIIVTMSSDTDAVERVAEDGFRTAKRHFSPINVGNQMTRLVQE